MQSSPELSIIIPNYNNAAFLDDSLQSILNQTFKDYEIIICDDCSTDNSIDILKSYAAKYPCIRYIVNKKNMGVAETRHSGILQAKGEYFTVLDSDDIFYDDRKLEKEMEIVKHFRQEYNKIVCAFSKIAILSEDLKYIKDQWPEDMIKQGYIFNEIIARSVMIPRDYIVATSAYFDVGKYDKHCTPFEDWDLKIRLASKYEYFYTGVYGTGYRRHPFGLSSIAHKLRTDSLNKVFEKNISLVTSKSDQARISAEFKEFMYKRDITRINYLKRNTGVRSKKYKVFSDLSLYYNVYKDMGFSGLRSLFNS